MRGKGTGGLVLLLLLLLPWAAAAQEPVGPPPPSSAVAGAGPDTHELLPDIGRIGAQVGVLGGASWNPFDAGRGVLAGGFIDLPVGRALGGKLSYEILLVLSLARSDPFEVAETGGARTVRTRLRLLQVSPFSLKYTITRWDRARLRPFVAAGADVLVAGTREERVGGAGPPDQAPELAERGVPTGQASLELGGHGGAGLELRLTGGLSWNFEYRFTAWEGRNARLHAATSAVGIHW